MKKPSRCRGEMGSCKVFVNQNTSEKLVFSPPKNQLQDDLPICQGPSIAEKDARNIATASQSLYGDSNVIYEVFEELRGRYCTECWRRFKEVFWESMEGEDGK